MTDIEVLLTDLGEIATRDIAKTEHPQGFNENMTVAKRGGQVANDARKSYEKQTKKSIFQIDFLALYIQLILIYTSIFSETPNKSIDIWIFLCLLN